MATGSAFAALDANPDRVTVESGKRSNIDVLRNDTDVSGSGISLTLTAVPGNGRAKVSDGKVQYLPNAGFTGRDTLRYRVTNRRGSYDEASVTITVEGSEPPPPPDAQPVARADRVSAEAGKGVSIEVLANDSGLEDGPVTVSVVGEPEAGRYRVVEDTVIQFRPPPDFQGTLSLSYAVTDADGDSSVASVTLDVGCQDCSVDETVVLSWDSHPDQVSGYWVMYGPSADSTIIRLSDLYSDVDVNSMDPSVTYSIAGDLDARSGERVCFRVGAFVDGRRSRDESELSSAVCTVL